MYRSEVHYDFIAQAVSALPFPVMANGNVYSAEKAEEVLRLTGARGLMIGRGAIRNPWIFHQFRQYQRGETPFIPRGLDVLNYVRALFESACSPTAHEAAQVQRMKKYMNYLGMGVEPTGEFLHRIRRVSTRSDFFAVCIEFLEHDRPMPLEPFRLDLHQADLLAGEHH
jgi:tRNA-dihydrouridine synthase